MRSDYAAIRTEHLRRYGEDVGNYGRLLVDLYSDRTQFLLELLQNAQDARASRVRFDLRPDRLEVRHNGRPFTEADVKGICGIKHSTKTDDPDQIGRFGVGFKSVYAYTSRPTVHCGDEHFEVRDYVHPYPADPVEPGAGWSTLQILPFDLPDVLPDDAVDEISNRLEQLTGRTILFLTNLTELEWLTPDGFSDRMCRLENRIDQTTRRVSLLDGADSEPQEEWLVFDRPVHLADGVDPGSVEVAFALTRDDDGGELITPALDTELVAFFPTSRETHVGFLIQGPFVPTASRDNVRDDHPLNRRLVDETAALTTEALELIKEMGLLKVGALETLPLGSADFAEGRFLRPLYEAVREALTNRPLLPTADGRHLAATQVRLARGAGLSQLFSPEQLGELLGLSGEIAWLDAGISAHRTPALYRYLVGYRPRLSFEQEIPAIVPGMELDPDAVVRRLEPSFLDRQSTDWMISLYQWFATQTALFATLRSKPVIRRSDGEHVVAFANGKPEVWLPPTGETSYPFVDRMIAADPESLHFLRDFGLTEPDAVDEVITAILPRYEGEKKPSQDEHSSNLERIAAALRGATGTKLFALKSELKFTPFLLAYNLADFKQEWHSPWDCYEPSEQLEVFLEGNEEALFLTDESLRHIDLWRDLDVKTGIEIRKKKPDPRGYVAVSNQHGWHVRGLNRFDPELEIVGLDYALKNPTLERSVVVWDLISSLDAPIRGECQRSTRRDYSGSSIYAETSPVADLLAEHQWLLDLDGNWCRPEEVTLEDLDPAYPRNEALAQILGIRPTVSRELADEVAGLLEIDRNDFEFLRRRPDQLRRFLAEVRESESGDVVDEDKGVVNESDAAEEMNEESDSENESVDVTDAIFEAFNREGVTSLEDFVGDGAAASPARRQERTAEELARSKDAEPSRRERFKVLPRKVWEPKDPVVRAYLLQTYGGRCQICQATFPRRDGRPFFEARYLVPRVARRWLDTPGNSLCLCSTCLAKTLYGSSKAAEILDELRELADDADNLPDGANVSFELCGEPVSIRFAQRHLIDLGVLLDAESSERE